MADTKISDLAAQTTLGDTDELVLAVAGANKKITGANLKTAVTGWTTVTKSGDETVASSTTVQNDDHLFFSTVSGALYEIECGIIFRNGGALPGLKVAFGEDSSSNRGVMFLVGISGGGTQVAAPFNTNQSSTHAFGGPLTTDQLITGFGGYCGGGGTFRMLWAQLTSDPGASTVKAGSYLRYRRVL